MNKKQLKQLKEHIKQNGGATIDANGHICAFNTGYMVSIAGFEKVTTLKVLNRRMLRTYLLHALLCNAYIGFWMDNGALYIDLSRKFSNKQVALHEGINNKQLAIYDCANNQSIYLNK